MSQYLSKRIKNCLITDNNKKHTKKKTQQNNRQTNTPQETKNNNKNLLTDLTHRYHPRVLGPWEHILSKIPRRGHRERIQQGKMLLQISIFVSRMRKLAHASAAQSTGTLPVKEWMYNDYIQCIDWMMECMNESIMYSSSWYHYK